MHVTVSENESQVYHLWLTAGSWPTLASTWALVTSTSSNLVTNSRSVTHSLGHLGRSLEGAAVLGGILDALIFLLKHPESSGRGEKVTCVYKCIFLSASQLAFNPFHTLFGFFCTVSVSSLNHTCKCTHTLRASLMVCVSWSVADC